MKYTSKVFMYGTIIFRPYTAEHGEWISSESLPHVQLAPENFKAFLIGLLFEKRDEHLAEL
jgi:hypothetical protein